MKKSVRITAWILALLFLLQVGIVVVLQSPAVQTFLGKQVITLVQKNIDADISFTSVSVRPFGALVLDNVLVKDRAPLVEGMDTLLFVNHLSARFSIMGIFTEEGISVSRLTLDGGCFHLVIEPNEQHPRHHGINLQRIFRLVPNEQKDNEMHWGKLLRARSVELSDIHFQMENLPGAERLAMIGKTLPPDVIDWNHLNVLLEHLKITRLRMEDDLISASVQQFFVHELTTGWRIDDLSARKVRVGKGNVHLEDFLAGVSPGSFLNVSALDMDGSLDEYNDFVNKVRLDVVFREGTCVDMQTISHVAPNLEKMHFRGRIRGRVTGTISDLQMQDLHIEGLDEALRIRLSGRIAGLPKVEDTQLDFHIRELSFGLGDLDDFIRDWAPEVKMNTDRLAPGERFLLSGNVDGALNRMHIDVDIDSRIGTARTELILSGAMNPRQAVGIGGELETQGLHLGRILGVKDLGPASLEARVEASLPPHKGDIAVRMDTLIVNRLQAKGYDYRDIYARAHYAPDDYGFVLHSDDPFFLLDAEGQYRENAEKDGFLDARLQLHHADLQRLNLDTRGVSQARFQADARLRRENARTRGELQTSGMVLRNEGGGHVIPDIGLQLDVSDSLHLLALRSGLMDADFKGERSLTEMLKDIRNLIVSEDLSALRVKKPEPYSGAFYEADVRLKNLQELFAFAMPGVYVENGTRLSLNIDSKGLMKADVTSGRIALRERYIKDMKLHADNDFGSLTGEISSSVIALSSLRLLGSRFTVFADDNQLGVGYVFDNENEDNTRAELYLSGELERVDNGIGINARVLPSNVYYKGNGWGIRSGDLRYADGSIRIDRLTARHENQQLLIDGSYTRGVADTLSVAMDQFDLGLLNSIAAGKIPQVDGRATGMAYIISSEHPTPGLLAEVACDSVQISGRRLGMLSLQSVWDEENERFKARMHNMLDGRSSITAEAYLQPKSSEASLNLQLDRFELGYAEHFLNSIFHEFNGAMSGEVRMAGKLDDLHLSSRNLRLDDGTLTLDFTRVPYRVSGPLSLDDEGLHFRDMDVSDGEDGSGVVNGGILMRLNKMDDIRMDTHVSIRNMRAIALPRGVNPLAYGNVYASGRVDITGPMNSLHLDIDATSVKSGEFHLPLGSGGTKRSHELLTFTEDLSLQEEDPYEQMMAAARQDKKKLNDLLFTARIQATPELRAFIELDEENSLNAVGNGTLELRSSSSQGNFTLGGDYAIQDGSFHFSALNLVSRNFTIQDGSTIRFNGEIMDTDLDVKGRYTTKASLSNLLPSYDESDNSSSRRTVYCGINISGKIRNPEVKFDIEVPDLNPLVQGMVESALNSEDKVQKQFVYLLLAGNFLPTEESGVTTNSSDVLFSNVSSIMSGQLNNIFQKLDIPLDLGLNYQTTQAGADLFDVAVSTQLFNNRVIVNGTVGNKKLEGGTTTNEVTGDLDIEIKLNRSGTMRMSLFSHSADQYTYYLDNSQRNGGGIAYQREFNSFGEFLRELFASRRKREEMTLEAAARSKQKIILQIDDSGKSETVHAIR